ncbi:hypothetical protein B0H16DRAFT_1479978 [Mycena metata]|uniref:Uncharacterized protein n=1 Tax=Mycena metata TaxID=1033252 RepID=A0AAD7H4R3_9AGAR|nr:hypothetical protein B0H16DRAFT_1479978 [Mycena metata]
MVGWYAEEADTAGKSWGKLVHHSPTAVVPPNLVLFPSRSPIDTYSVARAGRRRTGNLRDEGESVVYRIYSTKRPISQKIVSPEVCEIDGTSQMWRARDSGTMVNHTHRGIAHGLQHLRGVLELRVDLSFTRRRNDMHVETSTRWTRQMTNHGPCSTAAAARREGGKDYIEIVVELISFREKTRGVGGGGT